MRIGIITASLIQLLGQNCQRQLTFLLLMERCRQGCFAGLGMWSITCGPKEMGLGRKTSLRFQDVLIIALSIKLWTAMGHFLLVGAPLQAEIVCSSQF